jgi:hypothetical protein
MEYILGIIVVYSLIRLFKYLRGVNKEINNNWLPMSEGDDE